MSPYKDQRERVNETLKPCLQCQASCHLVPMTAPHHCPYSGPQTREHSLVWRENSVHFQSCEFHNGTVTDLPAGDRISTVNCVSQWLPLGSEKRHRAGAFLYHFHLSVLLEFLIMDVYWSIPAEVPGRLSSKYSHSDGCGISWWVWFAFPCWLRRLGVFSCTFPLQLLWQNVSSNLLLIFWVLGLLTVEL